MLIAQNKGPSGGLTESDRGYYGWRVVFAACFGVMVGFGSLFVYTFSVFVKPLGAEFGWSREAISRGFGFAALSMAFCSPALGRLLDRYGPRRVILPCLTIYGCGVASLAFLRPHLGQFYASCILLGVVGNGAAHLAYSRSISSWFNQRLGMALAFVMAGAGLGSMILPIFAQSIISRAGWRAAYLTLGGLALFVGWPLTWRYVHERTQPDRDSIASPHMGLTWQQGVRSFQFWIIVGVLFVSSVAMNGAVTQLAALLTDRGVTPVGAALCASTLGGSSLAGRVVIGWVLDRFFGARVAFVVYSITAAGVFLLARAGTLPMGCLAAGLIGVGAGGEADITPYLLTRYFGLRAFSTLYGLTWTFYAIAGAIGPVIMGRAFDSTGSYTSLLTVLALAVALAGLLMLVLPRYSRPDSMSVASDVVALVEP
ncbi:MAG TPA: MFS transporter [Terriglobia bacterium]|nr:MFS transporter [Terriglobia bacterium]